MNLSARLKIRPTGRVVGVDPSLTSTGIAVVYASGEVSTECVNTVGRRSDSLAERAARIRRIASAVGAFVPSLDGTHDPGPLLLVVEGPSHGSRGGSSWDRAGLWWQLVQCAIRRRVPVAVCPPSVRAMWATGNGRADKAAVASAVTRMTGVEFETSDAADAAALAWMGAMWLGWTTGPRTELLAKVAWPDPGVREVSS